MEGITPDFLRKNPQFCQTHPFDGVVVTAQVDSNWAKTHGLGEGSYVLDELSWSPHAVPFSAMQGTLDDLKHVAWGPLTDNFLWYRLAGEGREGPHAADLTNDRHWAAMENNAAVAARLCRQGGLKGLMLDTEQYGAYERLPSNPQLDESGQPNRVPFPLGIDEPSVLRKRGRQWIRAVQSEFPDIVIVIFFAWSPDLESAGFLAGVRHFLDGVLEGIQRPARLVHGYENTFYYGHAPGSRYTVEGFPGGRGRFEWARTSMQEWRRLSADPRKYDLFVEPGTAAWVESDPWDLWNGYPSGTKDSIWSNAPLALAYSDEYVWVWSEHTHYGHAYLRGEGPNPFLSSLSNQTFNTGAESTHELHEVFAADPLHHGWYFDFDMLQVGRKTSDAHLGAAFTLDAVPYAWSSANQALRVQNRWTTGARGEGVPNFSDQRQRYVHPLQPLGTWDSFLFSAEWIVERFASVADQPIALGLFDSDAPIAAGTASLHIASPTDVRILLAGGQRSWEHRLALSSPLETGKRYRATLRYDSAARSLVASLVETKSGKKIAACEERLPDAPESLRLDEAGVALWDGPQASPAAVDAPTVLHVHSVDLERK